MEAELEILRTVAERLEAAGIAYMVTGSFALNFYATPRMTRDIDVVVELDSADIDRVTQTFSSDFFVEPQAIELAIAHQKLFNIIHRDGILKIDFVIRKEGEFRKVEFGRRKKVKIDGFFAYIVSLEDLILSKAIWYRDTGSEQQKQDLRKLLAIDHDRSYLEGWSRRLELDATLKEFEQDR